MSDDSPLHEPQMNTDNPAEASQPQEDWRELRRQRRVARRGDGWIIGIILILLGTIFLLQNAGLLAFQNWWALFILIPALGALSSAWTRYRDTGLVDSAVRGSLFTGILLTLVAAAFLFNIQAVFFWPALLILAGVGILLNAMWR